MLPLNNESRVESRESRAGSCVRLLAAICLAGSLLSTLNPQPSTLLAADTMELPAEVRAWYRNPDGSCVQCSIGMVGVWNNNPNAATLLWDTDYGHAIRGGSTPSRVANYCNTRGISAFNVTGDTTTQ